MTSESVLALTSRRVARHTTINLIGLGVPIAMALVAVPILIANAGIDRFGFLALIWILIGYFSLFDLGLGRVITNVVAQQLSEGRNDQVSDTIWTGLLLMVALSALLSLVFFWGAEWIAVSMLKMPQHLHTDAVSSLQLVAGILPFVITSAGFRGALEGGHRFVSVAVIRILFAAAALFGPLVALEITDSLTAMVSAVCVGRLLAWMAALYATCRAYPMLLLRPSVSVSRIRRLLKLGIWMTVSNVVSPLLVNIDRLVIGAAVSIGAVAYYTTPADVITKLLIIPGALATALFPTLSSLKSVDTRISALFQQSIRVVGVSLGLGVLIVILFAEELLSVWIDADFASKSATVGRIIAVGVLANGIAHIPFTLIQAVQRPDLTAKIHLMEILPYVALLMLLVNFWGLEGAAVAWLIRVCADLVLLDYGVRRCGYGSRQIVVSLAWAYVLIGTVAGLLFISPSLWVRVWMLAAGCTLAIGAFHWWFVRRQVKSLN